MVVLLLPGPAGSLGTDQWDILTPCHHWTCHPELQRSKNTYVHDTPRRYKAMKTERRDSWSTGRIDPDTLPQSPRIKQSDSPPPAIKTRDSPAPSTMSDKNTSSSSDKT